MNAQQLRARALMEWRGLPQTTFAVDTAKALPAIVGKVMQEWGLGERLREEEISRSWVQIVGEFVGQHSSPHRLRQGVLSVRVLQPTLCYELDRVWKKDILAKLQERLGKRVIREVRFQVG
jgi:predicted nucleic acid-binding Zn ribbon protein